MRIGALSNFDRHKPPLQTDRKVVKWWVVDQELQITKEENLRLKSEIAHLKEMTTSTSQEITATKKEIESVHDSIETIENSMNNINEHEWSTLSIDDVRRVIQENNQDKKKKRGLLGWINGNHRH